MTNDATSTYLADWLGSGARRQSLEELSKLSIINDRWDRASYQEIATQMDSFTAARDQLGEFAPDSGWSLLEDTVYSLIKALPEQIPSGHMRPTHLINHLVTEVAVDLDEYERLHRYCVGDEVAAGMAAVSMEPQLEVILDRLNSERAKAQELAEMMQMYQDMQEDLDGVMQMLLQAEGGDEQGEGEGSPQDNKTLIEEQMKILEEQMKEKADEIDTGLALAESHILSLLATSMQEASDTASLQETACAMWGLNPGGVKQLPIDERVALAEKLNSEKFRKVAELFGSLKNYALSEQKRKVLHLPEEVVNIEQGNDLKRVLASERARLAHPVLRPLSILKLVGRKMPQLQLEGVEKIAKGSIIFCEDGSGSMGGAKEIWAKAVGLALLKIAQDQDRDFYGIHFGGTGEIYEFDFRGSGHTGEVLTYYSGHKSGYPEQKLSYIQGVVHFAEMFFAGGTDYVTPLSRAMQLQEEEYESNKRVNGDIVFVTDGQCGVPDKWLEAFKIRQDELGFKVWGIVIGGRPDGEPLNMICDGRVLQVSDLTSGRDLQNVFRNI